MQKISVGKGVKDEVVQGFQGHDQVFGFDSEGAEEPLQGSDHRRDKVST